jgi:hypothetical protein
MAAAWILRLRFGLMVITNEVLSQASEILVWTQSINIPTNCEQTSLYMPTVTKMMTVRMFKVMS